MMMSLPCLRGSCPNFLRIIYHSLSASQAPKRGACPTEKTDAGYSSCFYVWLLLTCIHLSWYWFTQWTLTISGSCWSFADAVRSGLHHLRVSVPEPCPVSDASHQLLDRVLDCNACIFVFYTAIAAWADTGYLISFNSFCESYVVPVFRMV